MFDWQGICDRYGLADLPDKATSLAIATPWAAFGDGFVTMGVGRVIEVGE